ncbi:MAG: amidohydrolase family protein [Holdemania massiliensis]
MLGCEDRIGSLEAGKDADLVLFDQNPVVSTSAHVMLTMVDGEVVYRR